MVISAVWIEKLELLTDRPAKNSYQNGLIKDKSTVLVIRLATLLIANWVPVHFGHVNVQTYLAATSGVFARTNGLDTSPFKIEISSIPLASIRRANSTICEVGRMGVLGCHNYQPNSLTEDRQLLLR